MHLVASACHSHGQVAVIAGEAGIGKSRLVTEVLAQWMAVQLPQPVQSAPLILRGRCFELDPATPYAPLLDLLSAHFVASTPEQLAANLLQYLKTDRRNGEDLVPPPTPASMGASTRIMPN